MPERFSLSIQGLSGASAMIHFRGLCRACSMEKGSRFIGLIFLWAIWAVLSPTPGARGEDVNPSGMKRWEALSPQEQEKILRNYETWKRLSPGEQMQVQKNLERLRQMSPEQRERVRENYRRFQSLPPERQRQLRNRFERFRRLSPEEQSRLRSRLAGPASGPKHPPARSPRAGAGKAGRGQPHKGSRPRR